MERRRAVLVNSSTNQPIDPHWQPLLLVDELEPANELMASNRLSLIWRWAPRLVELQGAAQLAGSIG